ncbi:MAG: hypothetical protein AMXMBFR84_29770 [Candidatus Hydrogenedentota bacterium]
MSSPPRILAFAGSARIESYNKKLIRVAVEGAQAAGGDVTLIDLRDYPLPLMDEDLEAREGLPENARTLKALFTAHQGLMISCPEYNSSITPLLKNTIDWVSRRGEGEQPLGCFEAKVAGLMSASPGALGGLRGLVVVRMLLGNIRVTVLPDQVAIGNAKDAFADNGALVDPKRDASIRNLGKAVVDAVRKLNAN